MAIGDFGKEYGKILNEIIERQFVRNSRYITTRCSKEHQALLDKGWEEIAGDDSTGWVMRQDMPGSAKKGAS